MTENHKNHKIESPSKPNSTRSTPSSSETDSKNKYVKTKQFTLLLIKSSMDVAIVLNPFCEICFEKKMNTKILAQFLIDAEEYVDLIRNGVQKGFNVRCVCSEVPLVGFGPRVPEDSGTQKSNSDIPQTKTSTIIDMAEKLLTNYGIIEEGNFFDQEDCKKRYKKWLTDNHPDRGGNEEICKNIILAFNTIFCIN